MNREDKSEGFQNPRATNTRSFIPRRGTTLLLTALLLALNLSVIHEAKADPWVTTGSMSTARNDHTATLLPNGKVLVAGGYFENGTNVYLSSAELYDPATGTWTNTGAMNTVRAHPTATLLPNGKVLVAGGYSDNGTYVFLSSAELYDPASGTWTNTGAMTTARDWHTATLLPNGKVLVAGGYNTNDGSYLSSAELYDPASGTWTNTGTMITAHMYHTATLLPNGKVLVAGSYDAGSGYPLSNAELYDPASGTWMATDPMTTGRFWQTATLLANGKVLVAGGNQNPISSTELYDPASGTWTNTGALNTARCYHTATLLPNGKVLVAGGYDYDYIPSVELYDPASGMWTATDSLNTGRSNPTATLLSNRMVLVTGGYNAGSGGPLSSAELYLLAPTITSQPASQSVPPGTDVTFSVSATGSEPLSYQWRLNGANIPGATNSTYSITNNVQPADGGSYDVLVFNSFGTVTSLIATLKVTVAALPFADNFANRGSTYDLSGVGSGSNTNGTREAGEPYHAGKFGNHSVWLVWIAPANGVATFNTRGSSFDTLLAVYTGTSLGSLTVVAANDDEGGGRFSSQVQFNAAAGTSYIIAVDGLGSAKGDIVLSWYLATSVPQIPMIITQPTNVTVSSGSNAFFSVSATCNTNLTYQWYYNDSLAISGATNNSLTVSNVGPSQVGLYRVNLTSATGQTVVSDEASLEIGSFVGAHSYDKLEDLLWQFSQSGGSGFSYLKFMALISSGSFPSVSAGSIGSQLINNFNSTTSQGEPIHDNVAGGSSRWYLLTATDNSTLKLDTLGSAISTVLAVYTGGDIFSLQQVASDRNSAPDGIHSLIRFPGKSGTNYLIAVDGVNGAQGNINLNWEVGVPPSVGGPGQNQAVGKGATLVLQGGDPNAVPAPSYQWFWNGANIPGATGATNSLPNIQYNQGGTYSVVVSNFMGVVTNLIALVSVDSPLKLDVSALPANVRIWGSATQAVVLLSSTNLTSWNPLYTNPSPLLPINYLDTNSLTRPNGYYRLKSWP